MTHFKMKLVLFLIFLGVMVQGFEIKSTYLSFCTLIYRKPCKELTREQQKLVVCSLMIHNPDEHMEYYTELFGKDYDMLRGDLNMWGYLKDRDLWQDEYSGLTVHTLARKDVRKIDEDSYCCPDGTCVQKKSDCDLN